MPIAVVSTEVRPNIRDSKLERRDLVRDDGKRRCGPGAARRTPDLTGTRLAAALKAYVEAFPQIKVSLVCGSSPELAEASTTGRVDLAVVEESIGPSAGECLGVERLVWAGAGTGAAYLKRPLSLLMVADTCAFRAVVLAALREPGQQLPAASPVTFQSWPSNER